MVRWIAPQPLAGSWRTYSSSGLFMNKSGGSAVHTVGDRQVRYEFAYPGLRVDGLPLHGSARVLVLGDSFTFGWGLEGDETYVHWLSKEAGAEAGPSYAFLNAASGGWGLDSFLRYVEEFGEHTDPCLVLVFINTDDVGRAFYNRLYEFNDGELKARRLAIPFAKRLVEVVPGYEFLLERSHLVALLRQAYLSAVAVTTPAAVEQRFLQGGPASHGIAEIPEAVNLAFAILEGLHRWSLTRGSDILFLSTGWHEPPYDDTEPTRAFMRRAPGWFEARGLTFVDLSPRLRPRFRELGEEAIIPGDGHPSPKAARLIGEEAWRVLRPFLTNSRCEGRRARVGE